MNQEEATPTVDLNKLASELTPDPAAAEASILAEAEKQAEDAAAIEVSDSIRAGDNVIAAAAAANANPEGKRFLRPDGTAYPAAAVDTITNDNPDMEEPGVPTEEKEYNVYYCARNSMRMITHKGLEIRFDHGRLVTDNAEVIAYLEEELGNGNRFITVNPEKRVMTTTDLDPMATLKRKHIQEYLIEQAAKSQLAAVAGSVAATGKEPRDMGNYDTNVAGVKPGSIKIPSTADLGGNAADSNS